MATQWINELLTWWDQLPPDMAFFFAIPFLVAVAGLLAHGHRPERRERRERWQRPQRSEKMNANAFEHRH